ncbi:MAG: substrate-binding domain-containing protein [Spirochaetia bacterium]|jgi:ribose transport system substrate-binding protein
MKRFLIILSALALCMVVVSTGAFAAGKKVKIAIVPVALNNPIFLDAIESSQKAGKELGADIIVAASTNPDATEQVKVVEGLIEQKVDGIMIFPTDPVALRGVVDKAVARGIKVAFLNGSIENTKCVFQAGTDNYALGKVCGEKMVKLMNGKGKIVVQTGTIGMSALDDRIQGFRDALKGSAIQEVAYQANEDNMEKSVEMVNTYLSAHPEVDGYFIDGGWPFFSPPEALPELQKFRDRGGIFGIVDTFYPMLKYMDRPKPLADFMIGQNYTAMGDYGTRTMYSLLTGGKIKDKVFYTNVEECTKDNVKQLLASKKPWGN